MWLVPKQLMRQEEGDTEWEWLLSRTLGTATVWILVDTATVVWFLFLLEVWD